MAGPTKIEWTDATWNPVTGCTKVSPGCKHCYAERMAARLQAMGKAHYRKGFQLQVHPDSVDTPRGWRRPKMVFVNSMSDLFHPGVGIEFTQRVFEVMNECPQHTFQVLTKRPEVALRLASELEWTPNIWLGTSLESSEYLQRLDDLLEVPARTRFISFEPLLGPIPRFRLKGIHWVIVGGESGPGARPLDGDWVRQIRDNCIRRNVPFFFKQWGGVRKHLNGRLLDGRVWDEYPLPGRDQ